MGGLTPWPAEPLKEEVPMSFGTKRRAALQA